MHVIENLPNVVLESVCLRLQGYEKYQLDLQIVFFLTFFLAKTYFTESSKKNDSFFILLKHDVKFGYVYKYKSRQI